MLVTGCTSDVPGAIQPQRPSVDSLTDYRNVVGLAEYTFPKGADLATILSRVDAVVFGSVIRAQTTEEEGHFYSEESVKVVDALFVRKSAPSEIKTSWPIFRDGEKAVTFNGLALPEQGGQVVLLLRDLGDSRWTVFNTSSRISLQGDKLTPPPEIASAIPQSLSELRGQIDGLVAQGRIQDDRPLPGDPTDNPPSGEEVTIPGVGPNDALSIYATESGFCYRAKDVNPTCFPKVGGLGVHEVVLQPVGTSVFGIAGLEVESVTLQWPTSDASDPESVQVQVVHLDSGMDVNVFVVESRSDALPSVVSVSKTPPGD